MRFELEGAVVFSGDLAPAEGDLQVALVNIEEGAFMRGVPAGEEGPRLVHYYVKGPELVLTIASGKYVRAHEALLRLQKELSAALGRTHKIGARTVRVDRYAIEFELEREPLHRFNVPLVESLDFDGKTAKLVFEELSEELLRRNYVDRVMALVREKVDAQHYEGKAEFWELIWASEPREHPFSGDPTEEMDRLGWIEQGPGKGRWFYRPQAAAVLRAMERLAIEQVLLPLGFQEVISSALVPFDVWMRTGHLQGVANEIYYVSEPLTRDEVAWEEFTDLIKITREVPHDVLAKLIDKPRSGMTYAQCPNIYWSFTGRTIAEEDLPVKVFDRMANSFRYESGGRHGIERVDEFHRIEPVYIGTPEQLAELKDQLVERYKHVFNNIMELEWRMAWVSPFYLQQAGRDAGCEPSEAESDRSEGTIDFEAYMPYRGPRDEAEWLEFQNLSVLGDIYTESFNIKAQRGELWSGCSGIGLERWAAVFLAQKGLDPENWPTAFRKYAGEMPAGIRFL